MTTTNLRRILTLGLTALVLAGCTATTSESTPTNSPSPTQTTQENGSSTQETTEPSAAETAAPIEAEAQPEESVQITQELDFSIAGGCLDSYDQVGYYGIFEEFDDNCELIVEVFPTEPSRFVELQYFEDTWVTEDTAYTDSQGIARLFVDVYCEDGYWCEGAWDYRLIVDAEGSLPADRSPVFELEFVSW